MATNITIEQVREFIRIAGAPELELVSDIMKSRWKHLQATLAMSYTRGDKVSFEGGRKEGFRRVRGEVKAVDGKWLYVKTDRFVDGYHRGEWDIKVSPSLCRKET